MTEIPSWRPHAAWHGFAPNPDGSAAGLDPGSVLHTLDELASISVGALRFTGVEGANDGALRRLLRHAVGTGLEVEVQLHHEVTAATLAMLADSRIARVSVPLAGPDARTHDHRRGVEGELDRLQAFIEKVRTTTIELEIRTPLHADIAPQMKDMARLVERWGGSRWLISAPLVLDAGLDGAAIEKALSEVIATVTRGGCPVITHHAPFFLRLCDQAGAPGACGARDERNGLCILPSGEIVPDFGIPWVVGNVRGGRLGALFDGHPLLRALRDPDAVEGKCGRCEFRTVCGGSRARSLAQGGNLFGSDPACSYRA